MVAAGLLGGLAAAGAVFALAVGPGQDEPGVLSPALVVTPTTTSGTASTGPTPSTVPSGAPSGSALPDSDDAADDPEEVPQPVETLDDDD
ncbi:hypothetical protein [Kineosporia sp. A_224]|uniref:hypothetical protein n=1 Tax=Kineosporia sp. A_224 TaxID=1962180 RepID=UPI001179B9BD|nr:hypothetical protein [Kineosporia sp. A_224]